MGVGLQRRAGAADDPALDRGGAAARELVGAHVGPTHSHTTGRVHDIAFRAITALFGHFGIEWDIRQATPHERDVLAQAIALYKEHRALLHSGVRVNADIVEPNLVLHGVVAQDGGEALFAAVALGTLAAETPGRVGLPGLDPDRVYRVEGLLPAARVAGEAGSDGDAQAPGGETEGREAADVHAPIAGVAHPVGEERDAFVQIAPPAWWRAAASRPAGVSSPRWGCHCPCSAPSTRCFYGPSPSEPSGCTDGSPVVERARGPSTVLSERSESKRRRRRLLGETTLGISEVRTLRPGSPRFDSPSARSSTDARSTAGAAVGRLG